MDGILPSMEETITIEVMTELGWIRLEMTRAQSAEMQRTISNAWVNYRRGTVRTVREPERGFFDVPLPIFETSDNAERGNLS